jgi:hypothetical protein
MSESEEQREEHEWRREAILLAVAMGLIAGFMIWRGWDKVCPFDAETFSYFSDITTTLVNLGVLYAALVRGRSLIRWVLKQWEKLVATSPRIRAMFLSLWPRRSAGKPSAATYAAQREPTQDVTDGAPISAAAEPGPELQPLSAEGGDTYQPTRKSWWQRWKWPLFIVLAFIVATVVVPLVGNWASNVWENWDRSRTEQSGTEQTETVEVPQVGAETQDYVVPFRTPRVSCRLIARSFSPARNGGAYIDIVRLNSLTDECRIAYGSTIRVPASWDTSLPLN